MATHAYMSDYVSYGQAVLGDMLDFGVNTCGFSAVEIMRNFLVSGVAEAFADGNPKYLAGMNGCELLRAVWERIGLPEIGESDVMYMDKSPEYWAGWVLAYYQWEKGQSFEAILRAVPIERLIDLYYPYHEADIEKTVEEIEKLAATHEAA